MGYSAQLYLRTDYTKKNGTNPIYLRIIINRKKKDYSLNISVLPKHWNSKKDEIKMAANDAIQNNLIIQNNLQKAKDIFFDFQIKDKYLNIFEFDRLFNNASFNSQCFYQFANKQIELESGKFSNGTIGTWKTQVSKLIKFRSQLDFGQLDITFIKEYEAYMIKNLSNNENTVSKSMAFLKNMLNRAITEGIIEKNAFDNYAIKKIQGKREYLNISEIAILEKLLYSNDINDSKKNVLRYFLFSCYTGLRYSDVKRLKHKHIVDGVLKITTQKTKKTVEFPLLPQALSLVDKGLDEMQVFKVLADQPTNRYLKDICTIAGIKKHISFHCSRHSFATNSVDLGVPLEVVQSILGHSEIRETQTYAKITDRQKQVVIDKWKTA